VDLFGFGIWSIFLCGYFGFVMSWSIWLFEFVWFWNLEYVPTWLFGFVIFWF
jgi:hypothetical protein